MYSGICTCNNVYVQWYMYSVHTHLCIYERFSQGETVGMCIREAEEHITVTMVTEAYYCYYCVYEYFIVLK